MLFRKDQRQATAALLKEAVEWNKSSGIEGAGMATVWRKTAEFHLKTGEAKVAAESLEELQRLEPSLTTLAQLVTAYAKCDLGRETSFVYFSKLFLVMPGVILVKTLFSLIVKITF